MKAKEIREQSPEELEQRLNQIKEDLFRLRFRLATGELDNPHKVKELKKDVARILTVKRQNELSLSEKQKVETVERGKKVEKG